nr:hypothetical protein [Tanacetum cinerariifolium]
IEEIATEVVPPTPTSPSPSSPVIPSTSPHQSPSPPQPQAVEDSSHLVQQVLDKCAALVLRVEGLENANAAQQLEIIKLKAKDVETVFNQGRISVDMETDEGIELEVDQEKCAKEDTKVQEVVEVVTTAKLITKVVTAAATQVAAASTPIPTTKPAAKPKVFKIAAAHAKAAKRRKLSEEAQEANDLRGRLEIIQDEDDDVFVEAIPLAQKVPIVDYQRRFGDFMEVVKDRFFTKKPTNFLDEYLLLTLKTMFGELDEQDAIWRNQKSVHGLALVKRWKLLTSCGVHAKVKVVQDAAVAGHAK